MTTILIVALVLIACWLLALELRFHSLKGIAAESRELANEAAADARKAISKVLKKKMP